MYFYLIIALQVFCIYHLYKHKNDYYWIFLILFLPVIGCFIYLITQVYSKRDADKVTNDIVTLINPTKKVRDLEKKLQFSDTFQNRINLADAYFEIKDYNKAIFHYEESLKDNHVKDFHVISKLVESKFNVSDFNKAIHYAEIVKLNPNFNKSRVQFFYGLSLDKLNRLEEAEKQLRKIDQRYSYYEERLVLAKFLIKIDKLDDAYEILNELLAESQHMTNINKRKFKGVMVEASNLLENK